jgi:hypothetical protein
MADLNCSTCGTVVAAAGVLYNERGDVICQKCLMDSQTLESQKRLATKVKGIAYAGPALGLIALLFNPFFVVTIAAIGNGLYVLNSVKDPETAKLLGPVVEKAKVAAIAGMVLGVISAVLRLFVFAGAD